MTFLSLSGIYHISGKSTNLWQRMTKIMSIPCWFFSREFFQWVNEWWDVCASKCIKKYNHSREIPRIQNAWEILLLQVIEMQQLLHAGHLWRFLEPVEDLSKYNTFLVKILSIVNAKLLRMESFHGAMTNLEFRWETYSIISSPEKRNLKNIHRPC